MVFLFRLLTYISAVLVILHYGLFVFAIKDLIWDIKHKCRHPFLSYKQNIIAEYEAISLFEKLPVFLCILSIVLVFLSSSMFLEIIGYHHLALKDPGTYSFQVEISCADDEHNTYYLPAEISVELESNNDNSRPYNDRSFYIKKIHFSNGGYLYFQNETEILVDWPSFIVDQNGCEWECTLINKHYPTKKIKESTDITTKDFIFLGIQALPSFIILLFFIFKKENRYPDATE